MWLKNLLAFAVFAIASVVASNSTITCNSDGNPGLLIAQKYAVASYPLLLSNETIAEGLRPLVKSDKIATELENNSTAKFQLFECHLKHSSPHLNSTFWQIRHTSSNLCVSMKAPPVAHPKGSIGFQLRTDENRMVAKTCAGIHDNAIYDQVFYEQGDLHLVQFNALKNQTRRSPRFDGHDAYLVQQLNNWETKHDYYLFLSVSHKA
ncbi:hypothetical protein MEQU1_002054 [Malassezia equina]|uniref:Uncharacterized protein n=1 Tax=Malassezia equina TaxID=1381935 RepID=A0AAF0J3W9_9BASI|nr:hypothetical protein MEQU1_002054 [Malassezia equina]